MSHNRYHKVGKRHRRAPRYPRALAATLLLGASCTAHPANAPVGAEVADSACPVQVAAPVSSPPPSTSSSVAVVASSAPIASTAPVAPVPTTDTSGDIDLTVGAPKVFPEDSSKMPDVGCGGWCPPQWQLKLDAKDSEQIKARLRYCLQAAVHKGINLGKEGRLRVSVHVDAKGRAGKVQSDDSTGVSRAVIACGEALVKKIRFKTSHKYKRLADGAVYLPFDPKVH